MERILLHSCCGPCSTSVIERLRQDHEITVFYYNPCITDGSEYEKRKSEQIRYIREVNAERTGDEAEVEFLEGDYCPDVFLDLVKGLEGEPEGGARCSVCFRQRLEETAKKAEELGFGIFTTTLTVSPHKSYDTISSIGKELAEEKGLRFLDHDFKKKAGFQRSIELSKQHGLYRQDHCGCAFSRRG